MTTPQPPRPVPPAGEPPVGDGPAWAAAEAAADELYQELATAGFADECVGLRPVRNVAGRSVVALGTVDPDVARRLAELLRVTSTRTLYIVRTDQAPARAPDQRGATP